MRRICVGFNRDYIVKYIAVNSLRRHRKQVIAISLT